ATAEHLFLYDGARYDFIGLSVPSKPGTFGFGALQLNRGGITSRSAIDDPGVSVSNTQSVYMLGFGRRLTGRWSAGAAANVLDFDVAGRKDKSWGLDVGGQGAYPRDEFWGLRRVVWSFGAAVKNLVEPKITLVQDTEAFPRELRAGAGLSFQTASRPSAAGIVRHDRAMALLSVRRVSGDGGLYPGLGFSYGFEDLLVLRLGFDGELSAGMGFHTRDGKFFVDYAMANKSLSFAHRFTLSYRFIQPEAKAVETYRDEADDEYVRAKGQAEALARESYATGQALFKDEKYQEAQEPFRLAALLAPDNEEMTMARRRNQEAFRRKQIQEFSTDAALNPAPGQEPDAFVSIARLLDLGAPNRAELAAMLERLARRIPEDEFARISLEAFDRRAPAARRLLETGHVAQAGQVVENLLLLGGSRTAAGFEALRQAVAAKGEAVRAQFAGASTGADAQAAKAALAARRAFPDEAELSSRAEAALARCRAGNRLGIKERYYLRKLYYLAAMQYARKGGKDETRRAADLLEDILRRDPADEAADTLLDTMAGESLVNGR
ncbi:MAG: hypothetical protein PHF00_13420, partial [Elusimicrobia bacterium]|nr:hypothetical protein [Elusimicrobiota bacterium]